MAPAQPLTTTSAHDTYWTARLAHLHPDGRSHNVYDGILRARYQQSLKKSTDIEPGEVYRYDIDLGPTSKVFNRGHCIMLQISSSNFPAYARNLNTSGPQHEKKEGYPAVQSVLHYTDHPFLLILPMVRR